MKNISTKSWSTFILQ